MGQWLNDRLSILKAMEGYSFGSGFRADTVRVKLDANENWHIPKEKIQRLIRESLAEVDVRKYPLGLLDNLRTDLAKHFSLPEDAIVPTQGSDQGIDLLCQAFLQPGDRALIVSPTYSFYRLRSRVAGAQSVEISLNPDLSLPVDGILSAAKDGGIIFLCSPNNPTGNQYPTDDVLRLADATPGLVVVDEAYVDFGSQSLVKELRDRRNLVVLRTFSKAFGLADLRLGLVIAHPEWASSFLENVQYPYPLSSITILVALRLLREFQLVERGIESLKRERTWLREKLLEFAGGEPLPSDANFVLTNFPLDAAKVHRALLERGIATKRVGHVLNLPNCIRVTVGTREMNSTFLEALKEILSVA